MKEEEKVKKDKKGVLHRIVIGFVLGIMVCLLVYVLLAVYFKKDETVNNTGNENQEEVVDDEHTSEQDEEDATEEETEAVLNPEDYGNVAWATTLLASDTLVPTTADNLIQGDAPAGIETPQGGCTDGEYYYQAYIHMDTNSDQFNNECVIAKYDLNTGKLVKESEKLQLNHANDITYNSKLDCLVIAHNQPIANCITYLNPETLEVIKQFAIDYYMFSIDYNAKRDQYVIGQTSSQTFLVLNSDFEAVSEVFQPSKRTSSYTTQGMACDDDFIYFTFYKSNVISVYDWAGNFVTLIEMEEYIQDARYEPENLTVIDGEIYVGCGKKIGNGGFYAFKLSGFVPKPETETE